MSSASRLANGPLQGLRGRAVGLVLAWALGAVAAPSAAGPAGNAERGQALYERGLVAGQPVPATRPGLGPVPAHASACVNCHRPSGLGGSEGSLLVPPVVGELLFAAGRVPAHPARLDNRRWLRHQTRSAYTPALLARALNQGIDPDGHTLAAAMPRYRLDADQVADLSAYLSSLQLGPGPGMRDGVMHLATVITPQAPPARRRAVLEAMRAWSVGMGIGAVRFQWQAWTLTGPPETWADQLAVLWRQNPVYALVSGAGGEDWGPIEAACESHRTPCLLPVIDQLPQRTQRHWSVYFSAGLPAEARMLAQRLAQASSPPTRLVVWQDGALGRAASQALRQALPASLALPVVELETAPADAAAVQLAPGDALVLWLRPAAVQAWLQAHPEPATAGQAGRLVLSGQLAPPGSVEIPPAWRERTVWVSLRSDPDRQAGAATISRDPWATQLKLAADLDPQAVADVHAATYFFADALAQARGQWSPEHLLERLELAMDKRPAGWAYYRLSLGPGQRIAAQGGHLLGFAPPERTRVAPLPGYIRAED